MRKTTVLLALALALILVACNDNPPPTQIVIVISPTPETATPDTSITTSPGPTSSPPPTAAPTASPTVAPTPTQPSGPQTPIPTETPRPALFPTDVVAEVQIAEQVFEHGRMFWIRHTQQIWVMQAAPDDPKSGDWFCYNDTFVEGEPEVDPALTAPENMYQPRRGFGKLWRTYPDMQTALGWALTPEFELTSSYLYVAGGTVEGDQYFRGPGAHSLTTLYNERIVFYETERRGDCQGGTWRMAQ
jgi:hypothetical protein